MVKAPQYIFFLVCMIGNLSYAQDYIDPNWISTSPSTVRSVNVRSAISSYSDWCSYSVEQKLIDFMDREKRAEFQSSSLNVGDKFYSCMWMSACNRAWDSVDKLMKSAIRASKQIQMEDLPVQVKEVDEYNIQAKIEGKALKRVPQSLPQLGGKTDQTGLIYLTIPIEKFAHILSNDCRQILFDQKVQSFINPNFTEKNDSQDKAYTISNQYALGMFRNIHYQFVSLRQNHVVFLPEEEIYSDYYIYDLNVGDAITQEMYEKRYENQNQPDLRPFLD